MKAFWSERARLYRDDPRANTNDIWLREIEIAHVNKVIREGAFRQILDFGCANGFSTQKLAELNPEAHFDGVDLNPDMIDVATHSQRLPNLQFFQRDILREPVDRTYDFIYGIRVFQNIESLDLQRRVFDQLCEQLRPGGGLLLIESYVDGYSRLNDDRRRMNLAPLPIHEHLTLLTDEFDGHARQKLTFQSQEALSSSYYLVTRLLYSYIAKMSDEPIDYNHPIHQVAAMIPQIGDYGPQRATLYRKP